MRERREHISLVDEGVSLYDRERVEDVEFKLSYKRIVDNAINVHDANHQPGYVHKFYPNRKRPEKEAPFAFMLPAGKDPHEPVQHLAKACVDINEGYGLASVASLDTTKAARFDRATDLAIHRLEGYKKTGLLGVVFMVMRHEDAESPLIAGLLQDMTNDKETEIDELSEAEANHQGRIRKMRDAVDALEVPKMTLLTMDPYETPPVFEEATDPHIDAGTRLY